MRKGKYPLEKRCREPLAVEMRRVDLGRMAF